VSAAALVLLGIKISIVITVLGIGLSTTRGDATSVFRDPVQLVRSLLAMQVIVPLFAILVVRTFDLEIPVKIALIALSVSPVPPIWPKRTLQAGGELAYTIGLLVASSLLSILIIPSAVYMMESIFSVPLRMSPASIGSIVFVTVILPLFVGIEIRRLWPRFANRASETVTKAGFALLVLCALPLLVKSLPAMASLIGNGTLLTMIALVLVGLGAGHLLGGPVEGERTVLGLASATRHPAIALTIATANFPNELVPAAIVLYLLVSFIVSTPYVVWNKRHADRSHRPILAALR
jgi:BASS family bile acid:Na+ symporter